MKFSDLGKKLGPCGSQILFDVHFDLLILIIVL